jgi:hypothetical protein
MGKVIYTEEHVRYILDNYIKNEDKCVKETGHGIGSIKLMLRNIAATYGFVKFSKGNPMYARIADEFRYENLVFGSPMSKESFCKRFSIIE